jgi:anti-sigma factor RsiW
MQFNPATEDEAAQAITRLVDGTLSESERDAVESWAASSPDVARQVALQRQVVRELAGDGPAPPDRLVAAIEDRYRARGRDFAPTAPARSRRSGERRSPGTLRRTGSRPWLAPAGALGALAVVALALVIAVGGSGTAPSIDAAAGLAFVPATSGAPHVSSSKYLDVSYGGVTFPNYAKLGTVATGQLTNRIGGRPALTVYYRLPNGTRVSYTVFSGKPVPRPGAAKLVRYEGVPLHVYRMRNGLSVVTLVRHGRTCVLAAKTPEDVVLGLAAEPVLAQRA